MCACVKSQPYPYIGLMSSKLSSRRIEANDHDNCHLTWPPRAVPGQISNSLTLAMSLTSIGSQQTARWHLAPSLSPLRIYAKHVPPTGFQILFVIYLVYFLSSSNRAVINDKGWMLQNINRQYLKIYWLVYGDSSVPSHLPRTQPTSQQKGTGRLSALNPKLGDFCWSLSWL